MDRRKGSPISEGTQIVRLAFRLPKMSFQNVQERSKSRHFGVFPCLPSSDLPSHDTRLDRLLAAFDRLVCCERHKQQWMDWLLSGRFGQDTPAALSRLVVELALQRVECGQ